MKTKIAVLIVCALCAVIANSQTLVAVPAPTPPPPAPRASVNLSAAQVAVIVTSAKTPPTGTQYPALAVPTGTLSSANLFILPNGSGTESFRVGAQTISQQLTAPQVTSLVNTLLDPPQGAPYSVIQLPSGKTAAQIQSMSLMPKPDGTATLSFVFKS